ncbi:hypothetical protein SELMODRAFT_420310 [Selaginella moellendorffii]|uniref:F-box domain-containing protein n=1 Tax=Selaginella moellendorffii TaxID=88036 RepID=D8SBK9_SELML|nr:hypothetical protein SELMODRAFT_420310 [Selaginella moellendorffii]
MRRSVELDDSTLVEILSKVGDARQLAECSLVCKRWRELSSAVSRLHFDFEVSSMEEVRDAEDTISSVLHRAKYKAPGCLKELSVVLQCGYGDDQMEVSGHWLAWAAGSVTRLALQLEGLEWGPAVWSLIACSTAIQMIHISGTMGISTKSLVSCSLQALEVCKLVSPVPHALLPMLLASCPRLEVLSAVIVGGQSLTVSSGNLKALSVLGQCDEDLEAFELTIDAPQLEALLVGVHSPGTLVSIRLHSEDLKVASFYGCCVLDKRCEKESALRNALVLKDLLGVKGIGIHYKDVANLKLPQNSQLVWAICPAAESSSVMTRASIRLRSEDLRAAMLWFVSTGARISLFISSDPMMVLRELLGVHEVEKLVIHCRGVANWELLTLKPRYEYLRELFDLRSMTVVPRA